MDTQDIAGSAATLDIVALVGIQGTVDFPDTVAYLGTADSVAILVNQVIVAFLGTVDSADTQDTVE